MNFFLFAGDRYYPAGGARDMIGIFNDVNDETVFNAVLEKVGQRDIGQDERIWVNALSVQPETLGEQRYWEVRMRESLDHPALQFCSIKKDVEGLGPCGILPMERRVLRVESDQSEMEILYPRLDAEQRDVSWLP